SLSRSSTLHQHSPCISHLLLSPLHSLPSRSLFQRSPLLDLHSTLALIKSPPCAAPTVSFFQVVVLPVKVARITTLPHPAHPRVKSSAVRTLLSGSQLHVLLPALHAH
ncbi:hypothetical protein BDP27DRAFT_1453248, partial [Rhodocollybia butyracea]